MTKRLILAATIVCGLILLAPAPAHAKVYGGLGIGQSSTSDIDADDLDDGSFISSSTDDSDTGWKGFVGYRFLKFFSLELAYVDLGEFSISAESDGTGLLYAPGNVSGSVDADTAALQAMGILPLGERFSIYVKFGYHAWDAKVRLSDSLDSASTSEDGEDAMYGLGVNFGLKGAGSIRLEYELYELEDVDVDLISVAFAFRF